METAAAEGQAFDLWPIVYPGQQLAARGRAMSPARGQSAELQFLLDPGTPLVDAPFVQRRRAHSAGSESPGASLPATRVDSGSAVLPFGAEAVAQQIDEQTGPQNIESPSTVAERGLSGPGQALPHQKEMEQSFGVELGHVRAHWDDRSRDANEELGSTAYTVNDRIGFKDPNPDQALVAHEVTHVLQQTRSPSYSAKDEGGVDTAGESEANAVASAVESNKPAREALNGTTRGEGRGAGQALVSRKPALFLPKNVGLNVLEFGNRGAKTMEGSYNLTPSAPKFYCGLVPFSIIPVPARPVVPGFYGRFAPELKLKLTPIATNYRHEISSVALQGALGFGVLGGIPDVAELFATAEPSLEGGGKIERKPQEGGSWWKLSLSLEMTGSLKAGLKVGPLTMQYKAGPYSLFKYVNLSYGSDGFQAGEAGLGKDLDAFLKKIWGKIKSIGRFISKYGEKAYKFLKTYGDKAIDFITPQGEVATEAIGLMAAISEGVGTFLDKAGKDWAKGLIRQALIWKYSVNPDNWTADPVITYLGKQIYGKMRTSNADGLLVDALEALDVLGVETSVVKALATALARGQQVDPLDVEDLWAMSPLQVVDRLKSAGRVAFKRSPQEIAKDVLGD